MSSISSIYFFPGLDKDLATSQGIALLVDSGLSFSDSATCLLPVYENGGYESAGPSLGLGNEASSKLQELISDGMQLEFSFQFEGRDIDVWVATAHANPFLMWSWPTRSISDLDHDKQNHFRLLAAKFASRLSADYAVWSVDFSEVEQAFVVRHRRRLLSCSCRTHLDGNFEVWVNSKVADLPFSTDCELSPSHTLILEFNCYRYSRLIM